MTTTTAPHTSLDRFFDTLRRSPTPPRDHRPHASPASAPPSPPTSGSRPRSPASAPSSSPSSGIGVPAYLLAWLLLPDTAGQASTWSARCARASTGSIVLLVLAALSILPDPHPLSGFWTVVLIAGAVFAYLAFTRTVDRLQSPARGPASPVAHSAGHRRATPQDAQRW
ncbi:MAG: hypothetical protein V9F04_00130 [Dermatophilaceae bacterium]